MDKRGFLELPDDAIAEMTSVFDAPRILLGDATPNNSLLWACRQVAMAAKLDILRIPALQPEASDFEHLQQIAGESAFRCRRVDLAGAWWRHDHGPLLVFRQEDHAACAVIPGGRGQYRLIESSASGDETITPLDEKSAARLEVVAYMFYRPLPDRVLGWRDLLEFGLAGLGRDVRMLLAALAAASLLGLLFPIATGMIFDHVVPGANITLLSQFVMALAVSVVAATLFNTAEMVATMRLQLKMTASLQAALWDRLLRLPVSFFRQYTVGDLADRAGGIDEIQQTITSNVITTVIGGVFSVFTLSLMFYYHAGLALAAVLLVLLFASVNTFAALAQLKYQREMYETQGRLSGFLLQLLTNISKLRVSNKESVVFQRWLKPFVQVNRLFLKAETINIRLLVFSSIFSLLATAIMFLLVVTVARDLSFGQFIAFNAAFGQFFASVLAVSQVIADSLEIVPLYERSRPILAALPEDDGQGIDCSDLQGEIRIEQLNFRYPQAQRSMDQSLSPWVFKDLNLSIAAGEYVALVGPSGSGKSTLFRLLLGFESPDSGKISYDGHHLPSINIRTLRQHSGIVLQNSSLIPGTIWDNISFGASGISEAQGWDAAQKAQIDDDIRAMPMGMYTLIAESGKNISVGQRQRILIARALARQPKLLLFDEATSALDNVTQARISREIEQMNVTCVVAAHRLSTVVNADRICVFDHTGLVQQGTYAELAAQPGLFARLIERQTV